MITNRAKEEACRAYEDYLKLIYYFGKGVMLVVHIQRYMKHLGGKGKTSVWKDLRELEAKEIIDVHKIHNNSYIKLKKYALRYLLNKSSAEDTKSISYGFITIKKSLFINELILSYPLRGVNIDELIDYYSNNTTFINKDKQNSCILKNLPEDFATEELQKDIKNLDDIYAQQVKRLKTKSTGIKIEKQNNFNLNNMQSRNIHIISVNKNMVNVVFLDLNDSYTTSRITENFQLVYQYFCTIFPDSIIFNFAIVVVDTEGKIRIDKQMPKLNQCLQSKNVLNNFAIQGKNIKNRLSIHIKNLDLRAKLFSNVKILL